MLQLGQALQLQQAAGGMAATPPLVSLPQLLAGQAPPASGTACAQALDPALCAEGDADADAPAPKARKGALGAKVRRHTTAAKVAPPEAPAAAGEPGRPEAAPLQGDPGQG